MLGRWRGGRAGGQQTGALSPSEQVADVRPAGASALRALVSLSVKWGQYSTLSGLLWGERKRDRQAAERLVR